MIWLRYRWEDFLYWYSDKPFTKIWQGTKDRVDAVIFCLLLLVVGIYSPKSLRSMMVDSIMDNRKKK